MEFNERLQGLRKARSLTQEDLAEAIYVSRTAVSKWEFGRGYPSIDSLKELSRFFGVTMDELIGAGEAVDAADQDRKVFAEGYALFICGVLDVLAVLLLFIPAFGDGAVTSETVALLALAGVSPWLRATFGAVVCATVAAGVCEVIASRTERERLRRAALVAGLASSVAGVAVFIAARQPYAGIVLFAFLVAKGLLLSCRKR